jgi:NAD(P) transhydrogenase
MRPLPGAGSRVGTVTTLGSGKKIAADTVRYAAGRQRCTEHLDLANAALEADGRGRILVDDQYRTKVHQIYAVGDVIGFPALAASSMDQGRLAAYHAFNEPVQDLIDCRPIDIDTIPEVSCVGKDRSRADQCIDTLRIRGVTLPRTCPRPDRRRLARDA